MTIRAHHPVPPATTSSSMRAPTPPRRVSWRPAALLAVIILALTLLAASASTVWPELGPDRRPHPTLHGTPAEALAILLGNARTLALPLLLTAGRWHTHPSTRLVGDLLVTALVIANPVNVGLALGRHPVALPAYLPHLPLEDAALAMAQRLAHTTPPQPRPASLHWSAGLRGADAHRARRTHRDLRRPAQGLISVLRSVTKHTMLAAVLAWFATRVLRRLLGVAVLAALIAGAAGHAERRGLHVRALDRVSHCELSALVEVARQLPDAISRRSSRAHRTLPALGRLAACDGDRMLRRTRRR